MKKPRLGTNDWGTDDRGEQGFFDSWVTRDERENSTASAWRVALRQGSFAPGNPGMSTTGGRSASAENGTSMLGMFTSARASRLVSQSHLATWPARTYLMPQRTMQSPHRTQGSLDWR